MIIKNFLVINVTLFILSPYLMFSVPSLLVTVVFHNYTKGIDCIRIVTGERVMFRDGPLVSKQGWSQQADGLLHKICLYLPSYLLRKPFEL